MTSLPFDPYDFFGYVAPGLVVLGGVELTLEHPEILWREHHAVAILFIMLAAYVAGQIIA